MILSRTQIYREFSITPITFGVIEPLLHAEPKARHGRLLYDLGEEDAFVLACGRVHPASFGGEGKDSSHLLPFYRFLALRFLTTSLDELYDEIVFRNLTTERLNKNYIKQLQTRFIGRLPKELHKLAKEKAEPPEELQNKYDLLLNVLGVHFAYYNPDRIDEFCPFVSNRRVKANIEAILTTKGTPAQYLQMLQDVTSNIWQMLSLDFYRAFFYDIGFMNDADWKFYLSLLPPVERAEKTTVANMSTDVYSSKLGVQVHMRETMEVITKKLQRKIMTLLEMPGSGSARDLTQLVTAYGRIGTGVLEEIQVEKTTGFFENVKIKAVPAQFRLLEDSAAEVSSS